MARFKTSFIIPYVFNYFKLSRIWGQQAYEEYFRRHAVKDLAEFYQNERGLGYDEAEDRATDLIKRNGRDWDFVTSVMNDTITDEYVAELETSPSSYGHFDDEIGL